MKPIVIALLIWFVVLALLISFVAGAGETRTRPAPAENDRVRRVERAWRVRTILLGVLFVGLITIPFIGHGRVLRHLIGG